MKLLFYIVYFIYRLPVLRPVRNKYLLGLRSYTTDVQVALEHRLMFKSRRYRSVINGITRFQEAVFKKRVFVAY